jgi:vitamin B12 transporter
MVSLFAAIVASIVSPSPSPSPVPQIAHVVTSDRGVESVEHTARTTYVVTAAQIARDGDRTIADALSTVPGVNIVRYGPFGATATIGIRGNSSQQVLVLVDGLPTAGSQIDDVDLEQIPVSGVERVEVVEGGGSTLYGSGSIGGVINIITANNAKRYAATVASGSFGQESYAFDTPWISFQRTYATNDYGVTGGANRGNSQAGLTGFAAHHTFTAGAFDVTLAGTLASALVGTPGELGYYSPTSEQSNVNRNFRVTVDEHSAHAQSTLQLGISSQNLGFTCNTPVDNNCPNAYYPTPAPGQSSNPPYSQVLYDQHWMASLRNVADNAHQRLVYGVDLSRGIARIDEGTGGGSPFAADNEPIFDAYAQTAAFVQSQWFDDRGNEVYAGMRGERDGGVGGAFSPSLGGVARLTNDLQLRLNAATAFRAPIAEDLYYPGYSNPDLVPERTRVGDATLSEPSLWGGASLQWYTTSGSNLIVSPPPAYIPENVGHASIQGLEFLVQTPTERGFHATLGVDNLYRAQDLDTQQRISGRGPVFSVVTKLQYVAPVTSHFDGFTLEQQTQGPQEAADPYLAPQYALYEPATFTQVDASIGYRIAPAFILALRGYNLGNDRYAIYAGYPLPGRAFDIELRSR